MFKISANPTFSATVKIPSPEGDKPLKLVFKHKSKNELKAYFEETAKGDRPESAALMEIVGGWEEVDQPFSEQALGQVTQNYHGATRAIFDAYIAALNGAKEKN